MKQHYSDSHAHLTGDALFPEIDALLDRAWNNNVRTIVNICTDKESLERSYQIRSKYPWVFHTAATTPHDVVSEGEEFFPIVAEKARKGELVAVGETGLDYFYEHSPKEIQKKNFVRYLHLALECKLPVVIHCRDAFADFFDIVDAEYKNGPGVLHCFTGTLEEAKKGVDRGWYVSFSGIATFKKSEALREVAKHIPLDRILIETDSPFLAPQSHRGKQNEPSFLPDTARIIAETCAISAEELMLQTSKNCKNLFKLSS